MIVKNYDLKSSHEAGSYEPSSDYGRKPELDPLSINQAQESYYEFINMTKDSIPKYTS